jgi:hypothetical protein
VLRIRQNQIRKATFLRYWPRRHVRKHTRSLTSSDLLTSASGLSTTPALDQVDRSGRWQFRVSAQMPVPHQRAAHSIRQRAYTHLGHALSVTSSVLPQRLWFQLGQWSSRQSYRLPTLQQRLAKHSGMSGFTSTTNRRAILVVVVRAQVKNPSWPYPARSMNRCELQPPHFPAMRACFRTFLQLAF